MEDGADASPQEHNSFRKSVSDLFDDFEAGDLEDLDEKDFDTPFVPASSVVTTPYLNEGKNSKTESSLNFSCDDIAAKLKKSKSHKVVAAWDQSTVDKSLQTKEKKEPAMHPLILFFKDREIEEKYREYHFRLYSHRIRVALLIGVVVVFAITTVGAVTSPTYPIELAFPLFFGFFGVVGIFSFAVSFTSFWKLLWGPLVSLCFIACFTAQLVSANAHKRGLTPTASIILVCFMVLPFHAVHLHMLWSAFLSGLFAVVYLLYTFSLHEPLDITICAMVALLWAFFRYSDSIFEISLRQNFLLQKHLEDERDRLRMKLAIKTNAAAALDINDSSPVAIVVSAIERLKDNAALSANDIASLDVIVDLLSTGQLFSPNLSLHLQGGSGADDDMKAWLLQEMQRPSLGGNVLPVRKKSGNDRRMSSAPNALTPWAHLAPSLLEGTDDWSFDIFRLSENTSEKPLAVMASFLMDYHMLYDDLDIDMVAFNILAANIEAKYTASNPFHNSMHAADVMQTVNVFICHKKIMQLLSPLEKFILLTAAMAHDVDHSGCSNNFHISIQDEKAIRYNDRSVQENHHLATYFTTLKETRVLEKFSAGDRKTYRSSVIDLVLATDMTVHFELVSQFKTRLLSGAFDPENDQQDKMLVMKMILHVADISNAAKPYPTNVKWAERVMEEFFQQGEQEQKRGLPISAHMDRKTTAIPKVQVGFINFVVGPCYELWSAFIEVPRYYDTLMENVHRWEQAVEKGIVGIPDR